MIRVALEELLSKLGLDEQHRLVLGDVPMILTTRFFIATIQKVAEEVLGPDGAAAVMHRAGFMGGYHFAEAQARMFGLKGLDVVVKYHEIASFRGWLGSAEFIELSEEPLRVVVRLHSTLAQEWGNVGRPVCHIWRGIILGMVRFAAESVGRGARLVSREVKCIAKGDPHCEIVVEETT